MVIVSGKTTVLKSDPGEYPVKAVTIPGMTVNGKAVLTLAELDSIGDTRGQMDFYADCTLNTLTIRGEDKELQSNTDVYYVVDTDGTGQDAAAAMVAHLAAFVHHDPNGDRYLATQATNLLWVDNKRVDSYTPNGTITKPFKKIQDALDAISGALTTNRWQINIAPGAHYSDPITIDESHVSLVGGSMETTRISGLITITQTANLGSIVLKDLRISGGLLCQRNHYILTVIDCLTNTVAWNLSPTAPADDEWLQIYGGLWYADCNTTNVYVYHHHGQAFGSWSVTNKEANFNSCDLNDPFQLTLVGTTMGVAYGNRTGNSDFIVGAGCTLYIDGGTEGGSNISGAGTIYRTTRMYLNAAAPSTPVVGQPWVDSSGGPGAFALKVWSGAAWETV